MSPTAAMNVAATITLTPGDGHQPLDLRPATAPRPRSAARPRRSRRRGSRPGASRSRRSRARTNGSSCSASQRRPLTPNRSDAGGRSFRQRINTAWISFFARERARTSCDAPREPPAHRADPLIRRPDAIELTRPEQLRQRPGVEAIGLRPRLADPGVTRRDDDHARDMRLEDPRDRPRVARHLQARPGRADQDSARTAPAPPAAPRSGPPSAAGPPRRSRPRRSRDEHPALLLAPVLLAVDDEQENRWANDIDGSALAAQPGKSQGRPMKSPGSNRPSSKPACPACVLPEGPCPSRPNLSPPPDDTSAFSEQFHAPTSDSGRYAEQGPPTLKHLRDRKVDPMMSIGT